MMLRILALTCTLALLSVATLTAQGVATSERYPVTAADTVVLLSRDFILPASLTLALNDTTPLAPPFDYSFDPVTSTIRLSPSLRSRLAADSLYLHTITASYSYRPIGLKREYYNRRLVERVDSTGTRRSVAERSGELTSASIFGKNLQRSGSIVRGFTVGTNRDVTLQSGLRLQFSGKITDDVEVLGALTDEQTPIQPEGNTQTLNEIDNIFFEVRSTHIGGTLGKFIAQSPTSGYTYFSRKLQGVKVSSRFAGVGSTDVVAAISPGKYRVQQAQGRERDQGPYRLTGQNNERNIIVVAGTERVFVDGVAMVRGENNDYVIDYGAGEVTFQTRRPITSASRITIEFEYTDRQFSRSFVAASHTGHLFDSTVTLTGSYVREADDPDATVDITLSEADRALIAGAGGERGRALRSGAYLVGRDDTVRGTYVRVDTTINGRADSIYRYLPDDPGAIYNVIFSTPIDGRGDYRYVAFGQYEYVGTGLGNYLPVVYLPLPELRQVGSLLFTSRPAVGVDIAGEVAFSSTSLNRLSLDPSANLKGLAFNARASAIRDSVTIGGSNIGGVRFGGSAQYIQAGFQTVDRIGEVEFSNRWNAESRPGQSRQDDFIAEGVLDYLPYDRLLLSASNGYLSRGGSFFSFRQQYSARFLGDTLLPSADYTVEVISTDSLSAADRGRWFKQRGGVSYTLAGFTPGFRFEWERREDRAGQSETDTLYPSSFRFLEFGPDLNVDLPFMRTAIRARYRIDDSSRVDSTRNAGSFLRDGISQTYTINGELRGVRNLSSTIDFTYRLKRYDSIAFVDPLRRLDNRTILVRSQTRWNAFDRGLDLDALYQVQTEQAARLQRLFVRVPFGQGEFIWIDFDSNGVQNDEEFRLTNAGDGEYIAVTIPTEQLFPIIDLRASLRLRLQPRRIIDSSSTLGKLLEPVTGETYLRLEEKSQSQQESDIYLLRLGRFQNDSTTLSGNATVQQDINLFESNPDYSFRLRYLARRGLTKLVRTVERTEGIERSLRSRWQPTFDIGLQLDLAANNSLLASSDTTSSRPFDLTTLSATNDLSYRPIQSLEVGWQLKLTQNRDDFPARPRTVFANTNAIRMVYSIETRGRIRLEVERTNAEGENLGGDTFSLPYQLTDGYAIGTTWIGRAGIEYRIGTNIQASFIYTGRAQPPTMRVFHIGQAEVRAFF